jgi:hypothetical protein
MSEANLWLGIATIGLTGLSIVVAATLKGWQGWLELKRSELGQGNGRSPAERIELADLRERVRSLESIAACIDP